MAAGSTRWRATAAGLVTLATVATATGCGGTAGSTPAAPSSATSTSPSPPTPTPTPTVSPAPAERPRARPAEPPSARALQAALLGLDTGRFRADLALGGTTVYREGSYRISDQSSSSTLVMDYGKPSAVTYHLITVGGAVYAQADDGNVLQMRQCWWRLSDEQVAAVIGDGSSEAGIGPEITALLSLRDEGRRSTAPLTAVAGLFGGETLAALGVAPGSPARVPVTVRYDDDGVLTGWGTTAGALFDAATDAGLTPDRVGRATAPIEVTFDRFGETVFIEAPPAEYVISLDLESGDRAIDRSVKACEAR